MYKRNCVRIQQIARAASRHKELGADLIEEVMYDTEGRFDGEKELRPIHLETADMHMSKFKAKNWDLWLVGFVTLSSPFGFYYCWEVGLDREESYWSLGGGNCEGLDRLITIVYREVLD